MKTCTKCKKEKGFSDFYRDKSHGDGLCCWCKSCNVTNDRIRRAKNPTKRKTTEKIWYLANREARIARAIRWGRENRERRNAITKKWKMANLDKVRDQTVRRRAKKRNAYVASVSRQEIFARDGGKCHICKKKVNPKKWHLDHIIPFAKDGTHEPKNVAVAHPKCNMQKHVTGMAQLRLIN
jgi:5-methylcytosine-specific restriction endonuclease McrA